MSSEELARVIADLASDIKAKNIKILDMRLVANFCDYFVICSGTSSRQVRSIAQGIEDGLLDRSIKVRFKQGYREGRWIIMDLGSVVAHVFDADMRDFYGLEYLWKEAKFVAWPGQET